MSHRYRRFPRLFLGLLSVLGSIELPSVKAGVNTLDFNSDPAPGTWQQLGSVVRRPDFGASEQPGDGYLSLTDAQPNQEALVVFKDLENGLVVASFMVEMDLRFGGGEAEPAEGFSLNYASMNDPFVWSLLGDSTTPDIYRGWSGTLNEPGRDHGRTGPGTPEEGTSTGLAIGFDLVASGPLFPSTDGEDVEGISIRADGNLVAQFPVPLRPLNFFPNAVVDPAPFRNLPTTDPHFAESLQTGALNPDRVDGSGNNESWKNLGWQKFVASVDDSAKIKISWKGVELTPLGGLPSGLSPLAGRLVFGARTGAASQNHHLDNIKLTTSGSVWEPVNNPSGFAYGFTVPFSNSGNSIVDLDSIVIRMGGQVVPGSATVDQGLVIWRSVMLDPPLPSGAVVTLETHYCDTLGRCRDRTTTFKVPDYATIPAASRLAGEATGDGFNVAMRQVESRDSARIFSPRTWDNNSIRVAESQISGAFGDNLISEATSGPDGVFATPLAGVINWDQDGASQGNFNSANGHPETKIPGVPGRAGNSTDNVTSVITTYLKLKKGYHRMGVNSDDGFVVSVGPGFDQLGTRLGAFDGGRGASDSIFDFVAPEDGWYPFRLSWWEGGEGANLEWFSVDLATGAKTLINDASMVGFVDAAPDGPTVSYIKTLLPYPNFPAAANDSIKAVLWSGTPPIDEASITMSVDGASVQVSKTFNGANLTVTYTPAQKFQFSSTHSVELSYTTGGVARTVNYGFRVRGASPADLPPSFVIEAEDFDQNGQAIPGTDAQPLTSGLAAGRGARLGMDYNHYGENNNGDVYRIGEGNGTTGYNSPMYENKGEPLDTQRPGPNGVYEVTSNYTLGWAGVGNGNNHWANYTRNIPLGKYRVYAALSHGDGNAWMQGSLHQVTSGVGTTHQTTGLLGIFQSPATGGWGASTLVPMQTLAREPAVIQLGGRMTLRFDYASGDFDYFLLVPTSDPAVANPLHEPGTFIVEAEDFNFGGGQMEPAANVMPYAGGTYAGRGAVAGVDYFRTYDEPSEAATYRVGESPNVPINAAWDDKESDRGLFQVTQNWKIGWSGDHWYNYTRTLPSGNYRVYAAMSHGDGPANTGRILGKLERVTGDPTKPEQPVESLGTFEGAGTAGWGNSYLFPVRRPDGAATVVQGADVPQTFRMTASMGDFDYIAFVPTPDPANPPPVEPIPPGFKSVYLNRLTRTLMAELDPERTMGFIKIQPGGKITSARIEGNRLVVTYE